KDVEAHSSRYRSAGTPTRRDTPPSGPPKPTIEPMGAPISWTVHCPPQAWVAASIFAALGGGGYSPVVETWDAIRTRRNVREYADRPIAAEDLDRILEAGRRSPSANNQQAWDFVAVTERDRLRA